MSAQAIRTSEKRGRATVGQCGGRAGAGAQAAHADDRQAAPHTAGTILIEAFSGKDSNRKTFPCGLWALQTHYESLLGSSWVCFLLRVPY